MQTGGDVGWLLTTASLRHTRRDPERTGLTGAMLTGGNATRDTCKVNGHKHDGSFGAQWARYVGGSMGQKVPEAQWARKCRGIRVCGRGQSSCHRCVLHHPHRPLPRCSPSSEPPPCFGDYGPLLCLPSATRWACCIGPAHRHGHATLST